MLALTRLAIFRRGGILKLSHAFPSSSFDCLRSQPPAILDSLPNSNGISEGIFLSSFFTSSSPPSSKFQQRRLVGWSPEQFFTVVTDVDEYYRFVPWCQKSQVIKRSGAESMEAELEVGFKMITERYISRVTMDRPHWVRSRVSNSLLFHHLDSNWKLEPGPSKETCWLTFDIDFAFNSHLYSSLADLFLSEVAKQMVNAFEGRAEALYGRSSLISIKEGRKI
jgi:coenzyme Q-binding protein COQ10